MAEKAIVYFERAALLQPDDVKWQLMIGESVKELIHIVFNFDARARILILLSFTANTKELGITYFKVYKIFGKFM